MIKFAAELCLLLLLIITLVLLQLLKIKFIDLITINKNEQVSNNKYKIDMLIESIMKMRCGSSW